MKSVDALRNWADGLRGVWIDPNDHTITVTTCDDMPPSIDCVSLREHVNAILDGIEREHKKACDDAWDNGYEADYLGIEKWLTEHPQVMEPHGWVRLPVDADGVPIHVGDVLDGYGKTIEVVEMRHGRSGWVLISRDGNGYADCAAFAHHHTPTVEDVLREFWSDVDLERADGCGDFSPIIAEYAAKLRLAEGSE